MRSPALVRRASRIRGRSNRLKSGRETRLASKRDRRVHREADTTSQPPHWDESLSGWHEEGVLERASGADEFVIFAPPSAAAARVIGGARGSTGTMREVLDWHTHMASHQSCLCRSNSSAAGRFSASRRCCRRGLRCRRGGPTRSSGPEVARSTHAHAPPARPSCSPSGLPSAEWTVERLE